MIEKILMQNCCASSWVNLINMAPFHSTNPLSLRQKKYGLAGATAMRAVMGFGANSIIHTAKLLEISSDLPVVIEIVDVEEKKCASSSSM